MKPDDDFLAGDLETPLVSTADHVVQRGAWAQDYNSVIRSLFTLKNLYVILGPILCAAVCLLVKLDGGSTGEASRNMLGILAWIFTWWLTESVPVPITSLAPLFLFPLFGISDADTVAHSYFDDVITLVIGSFILALAVEHYNLHRRLALTITLLFCGNPLNQQILLLGICGTTAFVSMWMHNVAAAMMMVPVATGVLQRLPSGPEKPAAATNFCKAVVLGVIYSAAIGGMTTLTGTGVNLILVGMWKTYFPDHNPITFSTWILFGLPLGILLFVSLWAILCLVYCRSGSSQVLSPYLDKAHLRKELETLGPISFPEKAILGLFLLQIVLWMTRNITEDIPGWGALFNGRAGDGTVSVLVATLLFIIPNKQEPGQKVMDWNKCKKLHWNIILLLGAGFAIADGVRTSGLASVLSQALDFLETAPYWAIAPAVGLVSGTITEFTSNNAAATLLIPLLIQLAVPMQVHPAILVIPATIGAQFAFLLPTGTPSNVVGFTTGHLEIKDMLLVGSLLKIVGLIFLSLLMPTLGAYVFVPR